MVDARQQLAETKEQAKLQATEDEQLKQSFQEEIKALQQEVSKWRVRAEVGPQNVSLMVHTVSFFFSKLRTTTKSLSIETTN